MTVDLRSIEEAKAALVERAGQSRDHSWSPAVFLLMVLAGVATALCAVQLIWF